MANSSKPDLRALRVLDGGMATELERRGRDISGPLWSAHVLDTAPEKIAQVHLDYLRAGADCISTVSYQVSAMGYAELGRPAADAASAIRQSVAIAEAARKEYSRQSGRPILIAVSLGPYGAALHNGAEFHGRYSIRFDDLVAFHTERLAVVADTNADLVAMETVPSLEEAKAIAAALARISSSLGMALVHLQGRRACCSWRTIGRVRRSARKGAPSRGGGHQLHVPRSDCLPYCRG